MDIISIKIPALPEYAQVVRLIAAGLASRLHFTLDDIEDLKIGVDELVGYMTGPLGHEGTLEITFRMRDEAIEITGVGRFSDIGPIRTQLSDLSRMILDTVVDSATLQLWDGAPTFNLLKGKTSASTPIMHGGT